MTKSVAGERRAKIETALGIGALAMTAGAFTGVGVITYARGDKVQAFLGSWGVAAVLLAITRAAAIPSGARRGPWNMATVIEDAVPGVGALVMLQRPRTRP